MKTLVVTQYFWPENFRVNDLVEELVRRGHEVTVLTGYPNYPDGQVYPVFKERARDFQSYGGAQIVRVPLLPRGRGRGFRLALNYASFAVSASTLGLWKIRRQSFDNIFVFEPSPITVGIPAGLLRRLRKIPVVFWVLDLWPETLVAIGVVRSRAVLQVVSKVVSWVYRHCDLILAQSQSFIPQIAEHCDDLKKIRYFASWAEAAENWEIVAPAPEVPYRADRFDVVFTGNIGEAQDFPAILAAAELLRARVEIRWIIVGDGRTAQWVRDEIERRDLRSNVLMVGRYPIERMPSFYRHADALLMSLKPDPIFAMTIPGKLQSYMFAGIPILAMIDGEGARIVAEADAGLTCAAGDASGLAAAVLKLSGMTLEERQAMGRRSREIGIREFDRKQQIDKLERWLKEVRFSGSGVGGGMR